MLLADLLIETFAAESVALRAEAAAGRPSADLHADVARVWSHDARLRARSTAVTIAGALTDGKMSSELGRWCERLLAVEPVNTIEPRRRIAQAVLDRRRYPFP